MVNSISSCNTSNSIPTSVRETSVATIYTKPSLNKILHDNTEYNKKTQSATFIQKILAYPTLSLIPVAPFLVGEIYLLGKRNKLKKLAAKTTENNTNYINFKNKLSKRLLILAGLALPIGFAMNYLNNKLKDKHFANAQNRVENYNKENNTNIKMLSHPMPSSYIGALFSPVSGEIVLGSMLNEDAILAKTHQKHLLNHELVHAGQYMLMARSENGIEKLNYLAMKKIASSLNEKGKKEVFDSYQEIKNGAQDTYKNKTINQLGYEINLVDYITALYKLSYEKDTTSKDIPIVINKEFYQNTINKQGKLTTEEEAKAKKYFEAYEKYPAKIGLLEAYNPGSNYRQNLLEKEAYKMNPWYTM